jgi:heme O synthase-like polyprenyltransferase
MDETSVHNADDLLHWLQQNTMTGVDSTSYVNKYLVESIDALVDRTAGPVTVKVKVQATYAGHYGDLVGYIANLSIWEGEQNYSAQFIYFPVMDGKIVNVLVSHRPGSLTA